VEVQVVMFEARGMPLFRLLLWSEGELLTAAACTCGGAGRGGAVCRKHGVMITEVTRDSEGWSGIFVDICTGYWFVNRVREMRWTHVKNYGTHTAVQRPAANITTFFVRGRGGWNSGFQPHSWFSFCLDKNIQHRP
jgi:hypothetical protein